MSIEMSIKGGSMVKDGIERSGFRIRAVMVGIWECFRGRLLKVCVSPGPIQWCLCRFLKHEETRTISSIALLCGMLVQGYPPASSSSIGSSKLPR